MSFRNNVFQPGTILREVIIGCLRANGSTFAGWCEENSVPRATALQAVCGQMSGPRGRSILEKLIDAAGPEAVSAAYRKRVEDEAARLREVA